MTRILGIETSCDETAIGIVDDGVVIRSNVVASSQALHRPYGGVVPEIASRAHVEVLWPVMAEAVERAGGRLDEIDAVAVTRGPGLAGALLSGVAFAKGLALALDRPLIGVDHLAAHLYAARMVDPTLALPYIGLIVSGGHTLLCVVHADQRFERLGETRDDAVGEAFDKVGKTLGLEYPGGPEIDRLSERGRRGAVTFPKFNQKDAFDFSFSGLKTAVYQHVSKRHAASTAASESWSPEETADIAAGFQEAAIDMLVTKTLKACQRTGIPRIVIGGGVAANRRLRERFMDEVGARKLQVVIPPADLCVDNGAMIAGVAFESLRHGRIAPLSMTADPALRLC